MLAAGVSLCAALAESLPMRLNDNLRVGIAALVACFVIAEGDFQLLRMVSVATAVGLLIAWKYPVADRSS